MDDANKRKRHPMSDLMKEEKHPIIEMNMSLNKNDDRQPTRRGFTMTDAEREQMNRILETAQKFKPYKGKR